MGATLFTVLYSQSYVSAMSDDSSRVIELKEIIVSSLQKTTQQNLLAFYRANKNATLEEIISRLPEVSLIRRGAYGMEPAIRSFSAGQINILIDGMRIHGACTDKMDPVTIYIEPSNLENLQVQTASNGFISGSSVGGTVNMKMAEPDLNTERKLSGTVNSGFQSASKSFYEAFQMNFASKKWAVRAGATYRNNQNYRAGNGNVVKFSQYEKMNYSFSAKYMLNPFTFIKTDLLADDGWNIGYPALPMDVGYASARIGAISFGRENHIKNMSKWHVKLYANQVRHFMDDTKRPNVPVHMDMPGMSKTYGALFDTEIDRKNKQKIQLKADLSSTFLKASMTMYQQGQIPMYMLTWPDNRKDQYGVSVSWSLPVDSSAKLQINSRNDLINYRLTTEEAKNQIGILGFSTTGRKYWLKNFSVQFSKKVNSKIKITGSIAYNERSVTATELFGFYLFNSNDGFDYIGNPDLKNENAWQAEVSGVYSNKKTRWQLNVFNSRIYHYILGEITPGFSSMTIGARGVKSFSNIPYADLSGFEVTGSLKPSHTTEFISTLRYNHSHDNKKQALPFMPPFKNISSFRYHPGRLSIQLEYEGALKQNRYNAKAGEDATPGYIILHFRLGYFFNLMKRKIGLQSGIENLLDKKYHEHLDWGNIARPGRNIYMQLQMLF